MNAKEFDHVVQARINLIQSVLSAKAKEYATEDRMHNFNVAARIMGCTPEKALWGMAIKHLVSVVDMVEDPHELTHEHIDEKIGDMINYLILLEGMLYELNPQSVEGGLL